MAIINREDIYRARKFKSKSPQITLDEVIKRQVKIKKGMSMMYFAMFGETRFKTRGEHSEEVAQIGAELARRLGGDHRKAWLIGMVHDFGHSLFAHSGEAPLGRFLIDPEGKGRFLTDEKGLREYEAINPREAFDHSKHGAKLLKITCNRIGLEVPEYIINGIESHSTGSNSSGAIKCESFEAECIMRADKIASSISDTQDMIKAGVFELTDESLSEVFDNNEVVRSTIKKRLFKDYRKNDKDFDDMLDFVIRLGGENSEQLKNISKPVDKNKVFEIFDRVTNEQIDKHIERIKNFIKLPAEEQRARMINLIVDGIENSGKKVDVITNENYSEVYPKGQLYVIPDAEAILAGLRGLLISMEDERKLGKTGPEIEGLVETVATYIYKNKKDFEHTRPFRTWKKDENNKRLEWKEQVAFGLAQMQDEEFKSFVIRLQEKPDVREALKNCKYRDPRDTVYMRKHPGVKLPFSTYDFSTKESIEKIWNVDVNRDYQPPMYEQIGMVDGGDKEIVQDRSISIDK